MTTDIFKENSFVWFSKTNRFPQRRQMPVDDETAEKYLLTYGKVERPVLGMKDDDWAKLVKKTKTELAMSKKLMPLKELDAISSALEAIITDALSLYCNRTSLGKGFHLCKTSLVETLEDFIAKRLADIRRSLVPALAAVYPAEKEKVRAVWGDKIASALPDIDALSGLFDMRLLPLTLAVPELAPEAKARFEAKLEAEYAAAKDTVIGGLWAEFQEFINHLVDRVTPNDDGTPKKFKVSTIDNLRGFIEAFENRDCFNDQKLAGLVLKANQMLADIGPNGEVPKRLRDFESMRKAAAVAFTSLKAEVDAGVEEVTQRKFTFAPDDEEKD